MVAWWYMWWLKWRCIFKQRTNNYCKQKRPILKVCKSSHTWWFGLGSSNRGKEEQFKKGLPHWKLVYRLTCVRTPCKDTKLYLNVNEHPGCLTLSPPAVKTQWLSQCQAFQSLVRSSHTLVNWTFDLLNQFAISLACFWKHWMLFASVCNINTLGQ
jgi:hypothetical protein